MLLYFYGDSFRDQTFVVQADPSFSVERVKAQFLHLIRPLGVEFLYFDLLHKGTALSEGLLLSDYHIFGNSDIDVRIFATNPEDDDQGAAILLDEVRELDLISKLSLLVKSCAVCLVALAMASFFSDEGWEMTWNFVISVQLFFATWKSRVFGLKAFLVLTPLAIAANLYVQIWYWTTPDGRCIWPSDGRVKWYCVPLSNGVLVAMIPFQVVGMLATVRFLSNLKFYPGKLFEKRLKESHTLRGMLLAARSKDKSESRFAVRAIAKYASASDHNAATLVDELAIRVLHDVAKYGDDGVKYHAAVAFNGLAAADDLHSVMISQDYLLDVLELARHKSDAVCSEAASALLRFTYEPEDIEALMATPGVVGTIRAIAMARDGEVQYYAKVAHENIDNYALTGGVDEGDGDEATNVGDGYGI